MKCAECKFTEWSDPKAAHYCSIGDHDKTIDISEEACDKGRSTFPKPGANKA